MTKHTARKALATAALVLIAGVGLTPIHASAEEKKKPPVTTTTTTKDTHPYLEVKLEEAFISSI